MERVVLNLREKRQAYEVFRRLWLVIKGELAYGRGVHVEAKPSTRTLEQNAKMWAMLADISRQTLWHGQELTTDDWKNLFTASVKKLRVVPNLEGTGFVALGMATSRYTKAEMSAMIELMYAFGAEREVKWSASARDTALAEVAHG